uniref:Uncharacterized protein n=1 Tax=Trypanosoma congolense (strain IL3000) TaxID=1068625 RepID=G0UME6_TRYCI|nr:hypothetical protein, unlikely [Trypanosoma congolense IL3000]
MNSTRKGELSLSLILSRSTSCYLPFVHLFFLMHFSPHSVSFVILNSPYTYFLSSLFFKVPGKLNIFTPFFFFSCASPHLRIYMGMRRWHAFPRICLEALW